MPLVLKRHPSGDAPNHYLVYSGETQIGSIFLAAHIADSRNWSWHVQVTDLHGDAHHGYAESLEEGKLMIRAAWERWMKRTGVVDAPNADAK